MTSRDCIRIHVAVATTFMLAGCSSVRFEYPKLSGENLAVVASEWPGGGDVPVGKGKIPVRYTLEAPDASLTLIVNWLDGRSIGIASSIPIVAVSTTLGQATRTTAFEYEVAWDRASSSTESRAGETLEIRIELQQRADPIVVSGVIKRWGRLFEGFHI